MTGVEVLRSKWLITELRDGCVYKTEFVGNEWVPMDSPAGKMHSVGDVQWGSPKDARGKQTIRRTR